MDRDPVESIEKQVSRGQSRLTGLASQDEDNVESQATADRRGDTGEVGLKSATDNERVHPFRDCAADDELELAYLVAAQRHTGQIVALEKDARTAQGLAQASRLFERSGKLREPQAREGTDQRQPAGPGFRWHAAHHDRGSDTV